MRKDLAAYKNERAWIKDMLRYDRDNPSAFTLGAIRSVVRSGFDGEISAQIALSKILGLLDGLNEVQKRN